MRKKLISGLILIILSGCTGEKAESFWRLVEIGQNLKNGLPNYYTKEEKSQHRIESYKNFLKIRHLREKNCKDPNYSN